MKLARDLNLAYCTNVHRGETWEEIFGSLQRYVLRVKQKISPDNPFGIGLRLSHLASVELFDSKKLDHFRKWLDQHQLYVFTINGFPYGEFHGNRVKEKAYLPDWTSDERLSYTNRLFEVLTKLLPQGIEGSVSTVPGSYKSFIQTKEQRKRIFSNLLKCAQHIANLSENSGCHLHLGLEPEPLCLLENSAETISFFEEMWETYPREESLRTCVGINYDLCHFAIEFEDVENVITQFQYHGILVSKFHISSALKIRPTSKNKKALQSFVDPIYLHQVIGRSPNGLLTRFPDLDVALQSHDSIDSSLEEWRIHFHVPLHCPRTEYFDNTSDQILRLLALLKKNPALCSHFEIETYTWEVLPSHLKAYDVVDQLTAEYAWLLRQFQEHGITTTPYPSSII